MKRPSGPLKPTTFTTPLQICSMVTSSSGNDPPESFTCPFGMEASFFLADAALNSTSAKMVPRTIDLLCTYKILSLLS